MVSFRVVLIRLLSKATLCVCLSMGFISHVSMLLNNIYVLAGANQTWICFFYYYCIILQLLLDYITSITNFFFYFLHKLILTFVLLTHFVS